MFTNRPTSGRFRISSTTLPTYIEAMKPQKSAGCCWISSGPGDTPCTIIAASITAGIGPDGTPSASIGTIAPEVAALFADSGPATPATAPVAELLGMPRQPPLDRVGHEARDDVGRARAGCR